MNDKQNWQAGSKALSGSMRYNDKNILILGIGNLLLGDEGVGVHVAQRLQKMKLSAEVEVIDGGTGGFELIEHCRGKKKVIIVDAIKADAEPGAVLRFTPEEAGLMWRSPFSAHQSGARELLYFCKQLDPPPEVIIYGVVPKEMQDVSTDLSAIVESRMASLVAAVLEETKAKASRKDAETQRRRKEKQKHCSSK